VTDFTELVDLAAERLGGVVLAANDEFFAPKENLLKAAAPVWREGEYTDRGKWMDGWETRRRREPGHDWCLIRLGLPGVVGGIVVDTTHFRGNYPEYCSLEAAEVRGKPDVQQLVGEATGWVEILPKSALMGHTVNALPVRDDRRWTHLRFNIYPDGGVARLRVYGEVRPDWDRILASGAPVDLGALEHGGRVVAASDAFFGTPNHMLLPGHATHMGDGWETRRRRGPGHDWAIVRLGRPGILRRVELDTDHFKGNAPGACSLEAGLAPEHAAADPAGTALDWRELLAESRLQPHARHVFDQVAALGVVSHVRLNIFPDGGVARLRLFGTVTAPAR
jgi:allantoicase